MTEYVYPHRWREVPDGLKYEWTQETHGLTLRDYFAAMAMQGMRASEWHVNTSDVDISHKAYAQADAMLAERGKG